MPYQGGAYAGLSAVAGTDYSGPHNVDNPYYRSPNTLGVPVSKASDLGRGMGQVAVDFRLGWIGGGQWYNYTRNIPAGEYNVYAALSYGGTDPHQLHATLQQVSDPAASAPTLTELGTFDAPGSGDWGRNALVPLKDANGELVKLNLGGTTTLRMVFPTEVKVTNVVDNVTNVVTTVLGGSGDWDFMLLAPATTVVGPQPQFTSIKKNTDGTITIEWTGGGTLQAAAEVTGPWQDVPGAASPYTLSPTAAMTFGRIKR